VTSPAPEPDDSQRRYRAARTALESGLAAASTAAPGDLPALYEGVAAEGLAALERDPREPLLLNYTGVSLYELGARDAAAALFRGAARLDPELPHLAANLRQAERRGPAPRLPAEAAPRLPELERRARPVADRAHPAEGLTLSLCMIVRDEEEMLPRSLAAARPAVDEIVVVDTGSTDATIEIARSFGARVIEREWTGSFAEARNVSFEAASGDWLLYLDADEVLVAEDLPLLRELTGRTWREAFYLVETHHTGEIGDGTAVTHNALRVLRNRPQYRFEGRLHEQVAHRLPGGMPERVEATRVRVEHFGYLGAVRDAKEKSRRNIELLREQLDESGASPFLCFNLGSELAAAGDAEGARQQFERSWQLLAADPDPSRLGYVPALSVRLVKSLRLTGRRDQAEGRAAEALEMFPELTDLVMEQALTALAGGERQRAAALLKRCLELGDAPSRYSPTRGCGTYLAMVKLAELIREEGEEERAERLLRRCLAEHPGYLGTVLPLTELLLRRGAAPKQAVATIEAGVVEPTPSVRFMLATALYEAGHPAAAEPLYGAAAEAQPGNGFAQLGRAEALLSLRRYEEAATAAARVDADSPCAVAAARSELFSLVLARRSTAAATMRAGERGLPEDELALFCAWSGAGSAAYPQLTPELTGTVATMLEALLRVEEFEAFEGLLPALERGLAARDRHELLAGAYLRRGFLESAADEWIAACRESGADAAALEGLARVARARGLEEEAGLFAEEARQLTSSSG
jgi:tetratricopeptide (TPR) repeat protein